MNRRAFLTTLAALPFISILKRKPIKHMPSALVGCCLITSGGQGYVFHGSSCACFDAPVSMLTPTREIADAYRKWPTIEHYRA